MLAFVLKTALLGLITIIIPASSSITTNPNQQQPNSSKSCTDACHFFEYLRGRPFEEAVHNATERDHFCAAVEQQMSCLFSCTSASAGSGSGSGSGDSEGGHKLSLEQHRMLKQLSSLQGICQSDSRQALASLDTNHGEAFSRTLLKKD